MTSQQTSLMINLNLHIDMAEDIHCTFITIVNGIELKIWGFDEAPEELGDCLICVLKGTRTISEYETSVPVRTDYAKKVLEQMNLGIKSNSSVGIELCKIRK